MSLSGDYEESGCVFSMRVVDVGFDRTVLDVVMCSAMLKLNQDIRKDNPSRSRTIMCKVLAKDTDSTQLA